MSERFIAVFCVLSALSSVACGKSGGSTLQDCLSYCRSYQTCYSSNLINDEVLEYCESACESAENDDTISMDPSRLRCVEYEICDDFKACVNGEI